MIIATIGSFIWLYVGTVNKAVLSNRIAFLQTLGSQEGKDLILSMTLSDGSNVKYLIKPSPGDKKLEAQGREVVAEETVSSWELEKLGTALSVGEIALPLGVALKIAN